MKKMNDEFRKQLAGYGLTTANIIYRMPDHWQTFDTSPDFPELYKFLKFWNDNLEGPLFHVTIGHSHLIKPVELNNTTWLN